MKLRGKIVASLFLGSLVLIGFYQGGVIAQAQDDSAEENCVTCHRNQNAALVKQWESSVHAAEDVSCSDCHGADETDIDAWKHEGEWISTLVTPKDCGGCHEKESEEFAVSHHAKAGEILASLDNVLAEKMAGLPHNNADAVNGCWQCHGTIVKFERDGKGEIKRGKEGRPLLDSDTWPNSGIGRLNPDGSKGSCNACHSRHSFQTRVARSPENCGKCHMGPDHPQIEIYNESKHGIAFYANRDEMALDKQGEWVLGRDYHAAPTCATCHISSYMGPDGVVTGNSHDVGERISWTLRPVVSTRLNMVIYDDGFKEDYPHTRDLPKIGQTVTTTEKVVEDYELVSKKVKRKVAKLVTWQQRRAKMKGACLNCHSNSFVDNFYQQYDDLVMLYNEKFAIPAKKFMTDLTADGVLNAAAPFEHEVQWVFWELWHHEGRRARHGASMMGPDYTHWHGMYEVGKHYYQKFLPAVVKAAKLKSEALGKKYAERIDKMMLQEEHSWKKGLSPKEAEALRKMYQDRYDEN